MLGFQQLDIYSVEFIEEIFFAIEINESTVQPLIFRLGDIELSPNTLILMPDNDDFFAVEFDRDSSNQMLYYGAVNTGFQFVAEFQFMPHSNINDSQITQLAENGQVMVGGVILQLSNLTN